ncbi:hypothetical protein ACFL04_00740 [Patescibacteria group bacterium]
MKHLKDTNDKPVKGREMIANCGQKGTYIGPMTAHGDDKDTCNDCVAIHWREPMHMEVVVFET